MKWIYGIQSDEPEATASMPLLPKIALRGNFSLVIDHFISEMTDCTQRRKTEPCQPRFQLPRLRFALSGMALRKIDLREDPP